MIIFKMSAYYEQAAELSQKLTLWTLDKETQKQKKASNSRKKEKFIPVGRKEASEFP